MAPSIAISKFRASIHHRDDGGRVEGHYYNQHIRGKYRCLRVKKRRARP